ncbi:hypothetical protein [Desulfatibacillum aliphaticivorans]|uniref:hypothetical protein n=1 Tax=Desulfatibacillum aliphaticivorans TaxID=218208 RepID=UPI0004059DF5|nr:hypothetical protein [Desulfatibacillum aliphaticivorans]
MEKTVATCSAAPSKAMVRLYIAVIAVLAFTGFGQMPIFKRYYLADIPGLGWSANFFVTHAIHYLGASVLFFLMAYHITGYFLAGRHSCTLTKSGWTRVIFLAGLTVTGIFRVLKNMPDILFSPNFTMFIDFAHLGFAMLFLFSCLGFLIFRTGWLKEVTHN